MPFDQWDAVHDDAREVRKPTGSAADATDDADDAAKTGTASSSSTSSTASRASAEAPERDRPETLPDRSRTVDRVVERGLIDELMHDIEHRIDALGDRLLGRIDAAVDDMEHRIDDALDVLDATYARDAAPDVDARASRAPSLDVAQRAAAMTTDEALALATEHPGDVALLNRIHETMEAVATEYLGEASAWLDVRDRFLDVPDAASDVFGSTDADVPDAVRENVAQVLDLYARVAPDVRAAYVYLRTHEPDLNPELLGALDVDWMTSPPVRVASAAPTASA